MTTPASNRPSNSLDRRRFLRLLGSAGVLGAAGCASAPQQHTREIGADRLAEPEPTSTSQPQRTLTTTADRRLVVIELQGGNDGLAMLQPRNAGWLRDVRGDLMADDAELHVASDAFGWHPNLAGLHERGLAAVVGIGSAAPDFSHFEMEQRWWRGDSRPLSRVTTGFFGRLCDQLDVGDPVTGLSLSGASTPALLSERAVTVSLGDPGSLWFLRESDPWVSRLRRSLASVGGAASPESASATAARRGLADTMRFADVMVGIGEGDTERYPWTELGTQLRVASELIKLDAGARVLHVRLGGFDTHVGQPWRYDALMQELDEALTIFLDDLADQGLVDSTLVATTSEFGRRAEQNDGGSDHGGASTMLLCGAGVSGVHGVAPDLAALDDGNVVATARFEDYYATIAEDWFGVPAAEVLPNGGDVISGLIA